MAWKFVSSDNFPLPLLLEFKKFYIKDLRLSQDYLLYIQKFSKLPNYSWVKKRAEEDLNISIANLRKVNEAVSIARAKGID